MSFWVLLGYFCFDLVFGFLVLGFCFLVFWGVFCLFFKFNQKMCYV